MNTRQIKLFAFSLVLTALPMLTASAQVSINLSDNSAPAPASSATQIAANANALHTIALNRSGGIDGQVASINEASKTTTGLSGLNIFFVKDGQIIQQTQTGAHGAFTINGLTEGAYSFYAAGKNGLAAYGVYVTSQPQAASTNLLEAVAASSSNQALQQLIQRNAPEQVAASLKNAIQSVTQGTEIQASKQIRLINGRLYGQISSLLPQLQSIAGLQVQLIQNSETIAQVQTDGNGTFSVPDVEPGVYDYLIGGSNGFAAGRFEAIGNPNPMQQISYRRTISQLDACLTCPSQGIEQPVEYAMGQDAYLEPSYGDTMEAPIEYAGESVSYGGASGGSCGACNSGGSFDGGGIVRGNFGLSNGACCGGSRLGGGGGLNLGSRLGNLGGGRSLSGGRFGGGGGIGRLLTLGSFGAAITAIADDNPDDSSPNGN